MRESRRGAGPLVRQAGLLALVLAVVASLPVAAAARGRSSSERGRAPALRVRLSVHRSAHVLTVRLGSASGAKCTLRVSSRRRTASFTVWKVASSGWTLFKWGVPRDAPSGTWSFSATCAKGRRRGRVRRMTRMVHRGPANGPLVSALNGGGGKGGGSQSCQAVRQGGSGQVCFIGDPFARYADPYVGADIGQCTWYAAGMRPDLDGITTGDAAWWLREAAGKRLEGTVPVVGAIAVNTTADGGVGHVAYVAGVTNGGATLILDEANLYNNGGVFLNVSTPAADFQGYIYGGPAGSGPGSAPTTPPPTTQPTAPSQPSQPTVPAGTYAETAGGASNTWSDYATAGGTEGPQIPAGQTVGIACRVQGFTVSDGNDWWYRVASSPWSDNYYVSADAFYNNGQTSGSLSNTPFVDQKVALCPTSSPPTTTTPPTTTSPPTPAPPQTWSETVGGVAHTWTNYMNAGGSEGPSIAAYQTVQISCKVTGFTVSDGNNWWYRIASSPWNDAYYVSADAFYNNGQTSGSLSNTPFVDPAVPNC